MDETKILETVVNIHNEREKQFVNHINLLIKMNLSNRTESIIYYLNALYLLDCLTLQESNDLIDRLINIKWRGEET